MKTNEMKEKIIGLQNTINDDTNLKDLKITVKPFYVEEKAEVKDIFWSGVDCLFLTKLYKSRDFAKRQIQKLYSYKSKEGWFILNKGPTTVILGQSATLLKVIAEFENWKDEVRQTPFEVAFRDYYNKVVASLLEQIGCCRFDIPPAAGKLPEEMKCAECEDDMRYLEDNRVDLRVPKAKSQTDFRRSSIEPPPAIVALCHCPTSTHSSRTKLLPPGSAPSEPPIAGKTQKILRVFFFAGADSGHRSLQNWSSWTRLFTGNLMDKKPKNGKIRTPISTDFNVPVLVLKQIIAENNCKNTQEARNIFAKAVLTLAAFAMEFRDFSCPLSSQFHQLAAADQEFAESLSISTKEAQKCGQRTVDELREIKNCIMTALQVLEAIFKLHKLISAYNKEGLSELKEPLMVYIYWIIMAVVTCATRITVLTWDE
ncbi:Sieve element occlusion [Parasponia andersonii]|uniref:Sieve element occlusion n=1 Tax=Parasponia andersonii TaxID=3476 RepID=A0A2P5BWR4_PARAD|nr:Sieve element occlusion [Parasponia andersonii]